jgi:hypothetical protein
LPVSTRRRRVRRDAPWPRSRARRAAVRAATSNPLCRAPPECMATSGRVPKASPYNALTLDDNGQYSALYARGDSDATVLFWASNVPNNDHCLIDSAADFICNGTIVGGDDKAILVRHHVPPASLPCALLKVAGKRRRRACTSACARAKFLWGSSRRSESRPELRRPIAHMLPDDAVHRTTS